MNTMMATHTLRFYDHDYGIGRQYCHSKYDVFNLFIMWFYWFQKSFYIMGYVVVPGFSAHFIINWTKLNWNEFSDQYKHLKVLRDISGSILSPLLFEKSSFGCNHLTLSLVHCANIEHTSFTMFSRFYQWLFSILYGKNT